MKGKATFKGCSFLSAGYERKKGRKWQMRREKRREREREREKRKEREREDEREREKHTIIS